MSTTTHDEDALTVAGFVVGWWPGLEGGLKWPEDADNPDDNEVYAAAKRLLERL